MAKYGYCRVSSISQEKNYSLESQKDNLLKAGVPEGNIVFETGSGFRMDRPRLLDLIETVAPGDEIFVSRLDRIGRSLHGTIILIGDLKKKGVELKALDLPFAENSHFVSIFQTLILAFAELENTVRRERQLEGIVRARKDPNKYQGRAKKITERMAKEIDMQIERKLKIVEIAKLHQISRSTLYNYIREKKAFKKGPLEP